MAENHVEAVRLDIDGRALQTQIETDFFLSPFGLLHQS